MNESVYEILTSIGYTLTDSGQEYRTTPLYRDSDNESILSIRKKDGAWFDFKEQIGGDLEKLVQITLKLSSPEDVRKALGNKYRLIEKAESQKLLLKTQKKYPKEMLDRLIKRHKYWELKGISEETVSLFRGGIAYKGQMASRYVFPIFNMREDVVGFCGRDLLKIENSQRPKWKIIGEKKQWMHPFFFNHEIIKDKKEVIIVEGIGDMMALWDCDIKNTLCVFGVGGSSGIVKALLKCEPESIIISLDNDSDSGGAGNRGAKRLRNGLCKLFSPSNIKVRLPSRNDFGDMSKPEIKEWYAQI
jgi:DNA primase